MARLLPLLVMLASLAMVATDAFDARPGFLLVVVFGLIAIVQPRSLGWAIALLATVVVVGATDVGARGVRGLHWLAGLGAFTLAAAHLVATRLSVATAPRATRLPALLVAAACTVVGLLATLRVEPTLGAGASDEGIAADHAHHAHGHPIMASVYAAMLLGLAVLAASDPRSKTYAAGLAIGAGLFGLAIAAGTIEVPGAAVAAIAVGVVAHWRGRRVPPIPPACTVSRR